jgi:hypothetical protein
MWFKFELRSFDRFRFYSMRGISIVLKDVLTKLLSLFFHNLCILLSLEPSILRTIDLRVVLFDEFSSLNSILLVRGYPEPSNINLPEPLWEESFLLFEQWVIKKWTITQSFQWSLPIPIEFRYSFCLSFLLYCELLSKRPRVSRRMV